MIAPAGPHRYLVTRFTIHSIHRIGTRRTVSTTYRGGCICSTLTETNSRSKRKLTYDYSPLSVAQWITIRMQGANVQLPSADRRGRAPSYIPSLLVHRGPAQESTGDLCRHVRVSRICIHYIYTSTYIHMSGIGFRGVINI